MRKRNHRLNLLAGKRQTQITLKYGTIRRLDYDFILKLQPHLQHAKDSEINSIRIGRLKDTMSSKSYY